MSFVEKYENGGCDRYIYRFCKISRDFYVYITYSTVVLWQCCGSRSGRIKNLRLDPKWLIKVQGGRESLSYKWYEIVM
jgi:hypothetical protein